MPGQNEAIMNPAWERVMLTKTALANDPATCYPHGDHRQHDRIKFVQLSLADKNQIHLKEEKLQ